VLLLKGVGEPITGVGYVSDVWFYELGDGKLDAIKRDFAEDLQIEDPNMWRKYENASYATLIRLSHVRRIDPINYPKRDRRAWIVFEPNPAARKSLL
jgi:hypothetical protein